MTLLTTVFAVVDGTLFDPLGYPDSGRLFAIRPIAAGLSPGNSRQWTQAGATTWTAAVPDATLTLYNARQWVGVGEDVSEGPIGIAEVQANFFDVIGVRPPIGGFATGNFEDFDPDPSAFMMQICGFRGSGPQLYAICLRSEDTDGLLLWPPVVSVFRPVPSTRIDTISRIGASDGVVSVIDV